MSSPAPVNIPYSRQWVGDDDISAVADVLRSDWLTTGPAVDRFERAIAEFTGARHAVAVSSGTAALHAAMYAVGIGRGDEVIVPPMTFAATANAVLFQGGTPVFADVDPDTLLLDPVQVERRITPRTRAVVAVDYAGQPCDYDALARITQGYGLALIADGCHALGAEYKSRPVGSLADLTVFSFHAVKHITTGEGGMITTDDVSLARSMRRFRNHGIESDHRRRAETGAWFYEMTDLGYNYRLSDIQCALGASQLRKLPGWIARRRRIVREYDAAFAKLAGLRPLQVRPEVSHAWHLYVVALDPARGRDAVFRAFRAEGIGVNVHYIPVHLHPFYRRRLGTGVGTCPVAEEAYRHILSLPVFPRMRDEEIEAVIAAAARVMSKGELCELDTSGTAAVA
jgi:UDP-4-amino-4,6-dideoxy-N-acetyl-beta-L-altrosamine transaminase